MTEHVGLLVASARRRIKQAVLARAAPHRLASQQFWFLVALHETPGLSQVELAERVRADAPTVSRVIAGLTRRRLVRADPNPADRRRVSLSLTPAGKRLARELAITAWELRTAIVEGMSQAEQEALRVGLARIIVNLERLESNRFRRAASSRAKGLP